MSEVRLQVLACDSQNGTLLVVTDRKIIIAKVTQEFSVKAIASSKLHTPRIVKSFITGTKALILEQDVN